MPQNDPLETDNDELELATLYSRTEPVRLPPAKLPELSLMDRMVRLPDIDAVLQLINDGSYDEHLEAILAAGHARKRERRGVRRPHGLVR